MAYVEYGWDASSNLSAYNLNHLEEQYEEGVAAIDAHLHPNYYTTLEANTVFYHTGHMGSGSGFDADMLDGYHATSLIATGLPSGSIMIWFGDDSNVPTGWYICDGATHGGKTTPDLRGRFPVGAGAAPYILPGVTAGSMTVTPTASITVASHALTLAEIPPHGHVYTDYYNTGTATQFYTNAATDHAYDDTLRTTGGVVDGSAVGHTHTTGSTITFSDLDKRPPFKCYYFIMKG
jgi:microcystin-dependent protein